MDKEILFMSFNKKTGTISGASNNEKSVFGFAAPMTFKLPKTELVRFEKENNLTYVENYDIYNFNGENPLLLLKDCSRLRQNEDGSTTYFAESWEWV